jgi:hypothetical protein
MVATQQVGENNGMVALDKERLNVVLDLQKRWCILCQSCYDSC